MSGVKMAVEMVAKTMKPAIDWDRMGKIMVSDEARREFTKLHRTINNVNHQLQTKFIQEPEPIYWEYYMKEVVQRLVDMYK